LHGGGGGCRLRGDRRIVHAGGARPSWRDAMRARIFGATVALAGALAAAGPGAAANLVDPDWPCVQRKVPVLSIGQMWSEPIPEDDWQADPAVARLAPMLALRRTPIEEVETRAAAFAEGIPEAERAEKLAELFAGVLDAIQDERNAVIEGIGRYARRQTALAEAVEARQQELARLRAAPERDWDRIEEIEDTLAWDTRIYKERAQSLTYVCEAPVLLERRAFEIARLLAGMI
jgi:hypothetical protein